MGTIVPATWDFYARSMINTLTGIALLGSLATASLGGGVVTAATDAQASQPAAVTATASSYYPTPGMTNCEGRDAVIAQPGTYTLVGECPSIKVEARDVTLDASAALVGDLSAGSADVDVEARDVAGVLSVGSDSNVVVRSAGSINVYGTSSYVRAYANVPFVTLRGDDNFVEVIGTIGSLTTPGNGNHIEASRIVQATDHGVNNSIRIKK